MTCFNLKSAKDVLQMVNDNPALAGDALEYARDKTAFLEARGKALRARLWHKALEQLKALQDDCGAKAANDPKPEKVKKTPIKKPSVTKPQGETDPRIARGMVKRKIQGATMYVWPLKNHKLTLPKARACPDAMKRAYEAWKHGAPFEFSTVYQK